MLFRSFDETAQHTSIGKLHDLKSSIKDSLDQHKKYSDFKADLADKGIAIMENRSVSTGKISGISYKINESGQTWKGSSLGKDYSINGLARSGLKVENVSQSPIAEPTKTHQNDGKKIQIHRKTTSIHRQNHTKTQTKTPSAKRGRRMLQAEKRAFFNESDM